MKKALSVLSVLLAVAWIPHQSKADPPVVTMTRFEYASSQTRQSTATIVFRGLMIFRPDSERRYLDVGVLNAPEHEFRIQVKEVSPDGVAISSITMLGIKASRSEERPV